LATLLHQLTTVTYLAASITAVLGLALRAPRLSRAAVGVLVLGTVVHMGAFWGLHEIDPTPALTELPMAISLTTWLAALFFIGVLVWIKSLGLVVVVAPAAFLGAFLASVTLPRVGRIAPDASPLWSHLHVLLSSAGLALVGVAGAAGLLYLIHHRSIKRKRGVVFGPAMPSLEALDRVNTLAVTLGCLLLGLGLLTGMAWVRAAQGELWPGGFHANATLVAWVIYAGIVVLRFAGSPSARRAALHSAVGFSVMLVAVVGVRLLS